MMRNFEQVMPAAPFRVIYERLAPVLFIAMVFSAIAAPMGMAWLLPLLGLTVLLAYPTGVRLSMGSRLSLSLVRNNAIAPTCSLLACFAFLSTIWSSDKLQTLAAAGLFSLYLSSAWLACRGIEVESRGLIERLSNAVVLAVFAGAAFLIFELVTHSYIQRTLFTYIPVLRPSSPEHVGMLNGRVAFLAPDELNRGVAMLNVLLWLALLNISAQVKSGRSGSAAVPLASLVALATLLSPHAASQIAIVCAALIFLLHRLRPKLACALVFSGWLGAVMLVIPAVHVTYRANLIAADWLTENGRARIVIWEATAERYLSAPLLGIGAASTQHLTKLHATEKQPASDVQWQTGAHAHNIYLQTWYELGIVGAALLLSIGLLVLGFIFRLPPVPQGYVLSAFVAAAVISAFSWGIWQPWFMASWFFGAVLATLVTCRARDAFEKPSS